MKKNMATADRIIRILIAALFGTLYLNGNVTGALGVGMLIVGIVFLLTSIINFCPLYKLLGISTNKKIKTT